VNIIFDHTTVSFGLRFCYWPWHLESLALALGPKSLALALALGPKSLALALALIPQGLGLGLVTCVLGLGSQVLVNITV